MSKVSSTGFFYKRTGPLQSVLKKSTESIVVGSKQVSVQIQAAPLHRTDAAIINGTALGRTKKGDKLYTPFPRVGGCEGVGKVIDVGSDVSSGVKAGDLVWVAPVQGTWADKVVADGNLVHKIKADQASHAQFLSCYLTAQQLLSGFTKLSKDSVVIQNGGSSLVSLAVSAFAQQDGVNVFTAAAEGARFEKAAARHKQYNSQVFENNGAGLRKLRDAAGKKQAPTLALNGIGGSNFNELLKCLGKSGTAVTYGAQSGYGLTWSGSHHFFNDVTHKGFFLPTYLHKLDYSARQAQLEFVLERAAKGKISYPVTPVSSLDGLPDAWDKAFVEGGAKAVLNLK